MTKNTEMKVYLKQLRKFTNFKSYLNLIYYYIIFLQIFQCVLTQYTLISLKKKKKKETRMTGN